MSNPTTQQLLADRSYSSWVYGYDPSKGVAGNQAPDTNTKILNQYFNASTNTLGVLVGRLDSSGSVVGATLVFRGTQFSEPAYQTGLSGSAAHAAALAQDIYTNVEIVDGQKNGAMTFASTVGTQAQSFLQSAYPGVQLTDITGHSLGAAPADAAAGGLVSTGWGGSLVTFRRRQRGPIVAPVSF